VVPGTLVSCMTRTDDLNGTSLRCCDETLTSVLRQGLHVGDLPPLVVLKHVLTSEAR